jgi:Domain of unknown function DUF11/PASTA domain
MRLAVTSIESTSNRMNRAALSALARILVAIELLTVGVAQAAFANNCVISIKWPSDPSHPDMVAIRPPKMPDVVSCQLSAVEPTFRGAGLTVNPRYESNPLPKGQIITQSLPVGAALTPTTTIVLTVSNGPEAGSNFPEKTPTGPNQLTTAISEIATAIGTAPKPADLAASVTLKTPEPVRRGDAVHYVIAVSNAGPAVATGVAMGIKLTNLNAVRISGGCDREQCSLVDLPPRSTASVFVDAQVANDGTFAVGVAARSREPDPDRENNQAESRQQTEVTPVVDSIGTTPATTEIQQPPSPPPRPQNADLEVSTRLRATSAYSPGSVVQFVIVVTNHGPAVADQVPVTFGFVNLAKVRLSGSCTAIPCVIRQLRPKSPAIISMYAHIASAGKFGASISVASDVHDPNTGNNGSSASGFTNGTVPPPPCRYCPPLRAVLVALLIAVVASASVIRYRRRRWRQRIAAHASVDLVGMASVSALLAMNAPPIGMQVVIEPGRAGPMSSVSIVREEKLP